ncbi:hypothetical protein [Moorena sp. SIO4G3]|uniref:hypothetical protein n=1 Tax=Moorena sp. SIO4G3 TaxID=2607821 RepID=UPI00142B3FB3|nr:hypothetical protein [Moorena sp. SIO4G3]NEO79520.1 hypothetical protein [Moorena sp. SIO4G3]
MIFRVGALSVMAPDCSPSRVAPVEWASSVELASCQFHAYFRAGRMPTNLLSITLFSNALNNRMIFRAGALSVMAPDCSPSRVAPVEWSSCVELASCQFHAYFRAGRMPTNLLFIL